MSDQEPPAYAPTATTSYTPSADIIGSYQEITRAQLMKTPLHREVYDALAEIFSLIIALETAEKSFIKDFFNDREKYRSTTSRLINQYRKLLGTFKDDQKKRDFLASMFEGKLSQDLINLPEVLSHRFNLAAPLAIQRLTQQAEPHPNELLRYAADEANRNSPSNTTNGGKTGKFARLIAQTTGSFITCMDALKLNYNTKDQLHPLLSDIVLNLNELVNSEEEDTEVLEPRALEFEGKSKLVSWLIKLNSLGDQTLTKEDIDTFLNDLDIAYKGFLSSLE